MDSTDRLTSTPSSAAATGSEPAPQRRLGDSLRWRITVSYAALLAFTGGVLLLFVNAAVRLASVPVETVRNFDPVSGFVYTQQFVDAGRQQTLDRLRFYSIIAFCVISAAGLCIGWLLSGRALRPIGQMASVARSIGERNLKERIALPGPEDELKQLADSFDAMVDRLDGAFERQRQFVADASHELRTPLTALQLGIEEVRRDPGAGIEEYRRVTAEVAASVERMRRLVEDLLALADESAPPPALSVALGPLCEAVVEELEPLASQRGIEVGCAVGPGVTVAVEPGMLRRALRNLVENGIRYGREGGHVRVEQLAAPPGRVAIAVTDDGIGIPADELGRIFDRFHRVESSRSRDAGGSGLGLSIVAKLVGLQDGSVAVESELGRGSRFTISLPAEAPGTPPGPAPTGARQPETPSGADR